MNTNGSRTWPTGRMRAMLRLRPCLRPRNETWAKPLLTSPTSSAYYARGGLIDLFCLTSGEQCHLPHNTFCFKSIFWCWSLYKLGPVLVPGSPAPILVPIPRTPSEVGADIFPEWIVALSSVIDIRSITSSFWGVVQVTCNTSAAVYLARPWQRLLLLFPLVMVG